MSKIDAIVKNAVQKASNQLARGELDLKSIVYRAVEEGMADAYERGRIAARPKRRTDK